MKLGIVGLPNVGKSTLFNSLTKAGAESANYPFCTIDPNVGVVTVPDKRLDVLGEMYHTKKIIPAAIEFVDIAGLVKGASKGEGLGNQFLANIREVDAIVHVVRCFENTNIVHVDGSIDPLRDIETINLELIFSDLEVLERRISKTVKLSRNDKMAAKELDLQNRLKAHLEENKMAKSFVTEDEDEQAWLAEYNLLTAKPVIFAANVSEDDLADDGVNNAGVQAVREYAKAEDCEVFVVCAEIEEEISQLDDDEKSMFLEDLGLEESGLEKLIKASYHLLGLISYLTAGEPEVRAWTIKKGTKAPQAAGKIHTDFERGFIRAEVVSYDDLMACGTHAAAKEKGLVRLEGKDYVVQDGDIMLFRFNVAIFKSIIPEIAKRDFGGILLVVANPVDILTQVAIKLSGLPEERVIGSGTVLDSARLRSKLGQHLSVDSRSVHAFIVGEHGDSEVVAWSSANVSGVPLSDMCEMRGHYNHKENTKEIADAVKNSAYEIINKKHATYYGIAMSVKRICEVIMRDEKSILPVSHMIHGVYEIDDVVLSMPVIVGADGIESDIPINLSGEEALKLKESADALKNIIDTLEL